MMPQAIKYKIFDSEVKSFDEKSLTVEHFISTEQVDRGKEVMRADGMRIKGKPVVLLQHGRTALGAEPIAKPVWIKKGTFKNKKGIIAKTKYFDDETGKRLWRKATEGFMPNWSIGYDVLNYQIKKDFVDILEWDLLEYSQVGVPMNPDAQMIYSKSYDNLETVYEDIEALADEDTKNIDVLPFRFLLITDEGTETGDDHESKGEKPYENEHSCRVVKKDWDSVNRENNKFGDGIHAIWGIKNDTVELASIRFDSSKHTEDQARKWCTDHDYTCDPFEPAKKKEAEDILNDTRNQIHELMKKQFEEFKENIFLTIDKKIDEKLKGFVPPSSDKPVSENKKEDETTDNNPRVRLIIKEDDEGLKERQKTENTQAFAVMIAEVVGTNFRKGIRSLLGKVD